MQSHACWLLGKEFLELQRAGPKGIQAQPVNNNLLQWEAKVEGLKNTLWEGAVLQLKLHFSEQYNSVPPIVEFDTIPFHPNVDKVSGKPCISYLDDRQEWQPALCIASILLSIQVMLSNPVLEGAVNPEAADMLWANPASYHKVVLDCVQASQKIERIGKQQNQRFVKRIRFEEYLDAWTKMATTKASSWMGNKSLEDLTKRSEAFVMYYGSPPGRESLLGHQHEVFKAIMYGTERKAPKKDPVSEGRQARIDQMKKIYLLYKTPDIHTPQLSVQRDPLGTQGFSRAQERQDWENEVDNLVAWTHSLSFEELEEEE